MNILLIGSGAREHALAWKLAQSSHVDRIFAAPGNGGTAGTPSCTNIPVPVDDSQTLRRFALDNRVDLTVVGPEQPLVAGIVDQFAADGLKIFGPSKAAAQLEGSKAFSKAFMNRHGIPTGWARVFTEFESAADFVHDLDDLPVLKASGLAAGKGVLLPASREEAVEQLRMMMVGRRFGDAGTTVLVEERLHGPELSVLAFCDGVNLRLVPAAQDHKRLLDGDLGPNTGGMGAFAPSPLATKEILDTVERQVLRPTLAGMAAEGSPYQGLLYAGLMLTEQGPMVLEFNCRFGDPEAQVILPLLQSDLVELMLACTDGTLAGCNPDWSAESAVTVVMASGGYPDDYETGKPIHGLPESSNFDGCQLVFHAGTKIDESDRRDDAEYRPVLLTDGGRVLSVTATGPDFKAAVDRAYQTVEQICFEGAVWRTDIGIHVAQSRENSP
ncbi:MAG: phosphoribosylamine--glycine ligase [Caldilineaceae bacterium]|nr:phosphoribosylamine--glycine ligase [Caldilineaceae bacterium]